MCPHCKRDLIGTALGGHITRCKLNPNLKIIRKKPLSDAHRKAASDGQKKFLLANPDKVAYRAYHSSKMSWPEIFFQDLLLSKKIEGWEYNYRAGIYTYDFAFPEFKLDVEIDGGTHKMPHVIEIDKRRDEWTRANGWSVLRIEASLLYTDKEKALAMLENHLRVV